MGCAPEREADAGDAAAAGDQPAVSAPEPRPAAPAALTPEGWGPLRIDMPRAAVVAALGDTADPDAMGGPDPARCDVFHPKRAPEGLFVMIENGRLTRISLVAPTRVRTDDGLGPGDTVARVRTVYGARLHIVPHKYVEPPAAYLTVWSIGDPGGDPAADYVEDAGVRGIRYVVDARGIVAAVHAGGPSIQYVEDCL